MPFLLIAAAAIMFGLYNVAIKLSAGHVNAVLGAVILQFVAAFLGLGYLLYQSGSSLGTLQVSTRGVWLAVVAGAAIGLVEILTFVIYGRGVAVAVGNPLIVGGSLLVTTTVGIVLLREDLSPLQMLAIVLVAAGVFLLAWGAR